jgi:hypothetical protein
MLRAKRGSALTRERTSHPASGRACAASARSAREPHPGGFGRRRQPVGPAHQAAGLHEPGRAKRLLRHEEPRPPADAVRDLVGLADEARAQFHGCGPDRDPIADLEVEPVEERRIDGCAINPVPSGQELGGRQRGLDHQLPTVG